MCAPPTPSQLDSVVQLRRARFTISVPASQHAGNEGNISIFVPPVPTPTKFYFQEDTGNLVPGSRFPVSYGGIMVNDYGATSLGYTTSGQFDAPPDAAWRVVGFGYELTNTTPQMYQSGSLITYQAPQTIHQGAWSGLGELIRTQTPLSHTSFEFASSAVGLPMPATIDEATAFPTTKQWDAKHGAYVIPRLTNFDGEFMAPGRTVSPDYRHI